MATPVVLDGSYGEGGGQIVRTAVALATLTGRAVRVENIRANRPQPGLRAQHAGLVRFLAHWTGGRARGAEVGSTAIDYEPGLPSPGDHVWDIGTAGSVTLFLQAVLPPLLLTPGRTRLMVRGGTDVPYAPPVDWYEALHLPWVAGVAQHVSFEVRQRGFYPKGGGEVVVEVQNPEGTFEHDAVAGRVAARLGGERMAQTPPVRAFVTSVAAAGLDAAGVAQRQADAATRRLEAAGVDVARVAVAQAPTRSPGSVCSVWLEDGRGNRVGADRLGARGVLAELVGEGAADEALEDWWTGATVDRHLADQVVPWIALGAGAVRVPRSTGHLETNVWTVRHFLGADAVRLQDGVLRGR